MEQKRVTENLELLGEWSTWWLSPASGCTTASFVALHVFILSALVLSATKKGQSQGLGVWDNQWQWQGSVLHKKGQGTLVLRRMREPARLSGTSGISGPVFLTRSSISPSHSSFLLSFLSLSLFLIFSSFPSKWKYWYCVYVLVCAHACLCSLQKLRRRQRCKEESKYASNSISQRRKNTVKYLVYFFKNFSWYSPSSVSLPFSL